MYDEIVSIPAFIDAMERKLEKSAQHNFQAWWMKTLPPWTNTRPSEPNNFRATLALMKDWYLEHVDFLHADINKAEVLPAGKNFGERDFNDNEITPQTFVIVAYGEMTDLKASFQLENLSNFEMSSDFSQTPTGKGGYIASVNVRPKKSLAIGWYTDFLVLSGNHQGKSFSFRLPLTFRKDTLFPGDIEPPKPITNNSELPFVNPLNAWVYNGKLFVTGLSVGETLNVFTATGALVHNQIVASNEAEIKLPTQGVYIIQSEDRTLRVAFVQ